MESKEYTELVQRLRAADWTNKGLTDDQSLEWDAADTIEELATSLSHYEQADKEGRLVILPKNNEPVWHIRKRSRNRTEREGER